MQVLQGGVCIGYTVYELFVIISFYFICLVCMFITSIKYKSFYLILVTIVQGAVQTLNCGNLQYGPVVNASTVTFNCTVDSLAITWTVPPNNNDLNFGASDNQGNIKETDGFIAVYTDATAPSSSSLIFNITENLNATTVTCRDSGLGGVTDSCLLLVKFSKYHLYNCYII